MSLPLLAEGEFALVREHLTKALAHPSALIKLGATAHDLDLYVSLAEAAARQRDLEGLREYAPRAEALAARYGHRLYQAVIHRAWGVLHRLAGPSEYAEAETRLGQALAQFREMNARWQMGRTLFELGELARARARPAEAHDHFYRALIAFEALGALPDAERSRAALQALAP